ncbi:hypothetical protein BC332_30707 [Capsicum chinense]|nr:hypothetical protein BC332_30707 [Capsicum chinense]
MGSQSQHNHPPAQSNLPNQQGTTSSTTSGQRPNRLYALQSRQDQESSPDVVAGMFHVFHLHFYALLDPGSSLSLFTPYLHVYALLDPEDGYPGGFCHIFEKRDWFEHF